MRVVHSDYLAAQRSRSSKRKPAEKKEGRGVSFVAVLAALLVVAAAATYAPGASGGDALVRAAHSRPSVSGVLAEVLSSQQRRMGSWAARLAKALVRLVGRALWEYLGAEAQG